MDDYNTASENNTSDEVSVSGNKKMEEIKPVKKLEKVKELKNHFIKTVMERIPETKINGKHNIHESSYTISNLCLPINSDKKTILNPILNLILNFIDYQMKHFAKEDFLLLN
mgnify:CR=1 FL=1